MKRLIALGLILSSWAYASDVITNNPVWDGSTNVFAWGNGGYYPTFGQTITVPTDGNDTLSSFTFNIFLQSVSIDFDANVQAWNGAETTGSPLFTGTGSLETSLIGGDATYTFNPNLVLTPGATYVLYFTTIGVTETTTDWYNWPGTSTDTYPGGAFVYSDTDHTAPASGAIADLNGSPWVITGEAAGATNVLDLAFSATFTGASNSVPEPQTFGMAGVSLSLLAAALFFRRRRTRSSGPA